MTKWDDLLQKTIDTPDFLSEINTKGFWKCDDSVIKYAKKNGVELDSNAPNYVSLDFWSKQSEILKNNDYYILRSGGGTFVILDKNNFLTHILIYQYQILYNWKPRRILSFQNYTRYLGKM